jgi:hypothetical protein
MADNTTLNTGTGGDVIASDDIAGVKHQRVKVEWGADGTATEVTDTTTGALPVKTSASGSVIANSTTPLGIGATYTTPVFDTSVSGHFFTGACIADQDGTYYIEESLDNTTWTELAQLPYTANTTAELDYAGHMRYVRARFVNGAVAQTVFRSSMAQRLAGANDRIGIDERFNAVVGDKSNNLSSPSATAHEVVGAVARSTAASYTDGNIAMPRLNLAGDTAVTLDGESVAVTGTFWQTTQPVSGTFWQATQPVSGTFWQATQPVSLASLPTLAAGTANIGDVDVASIVGSTTIATNQVTVGATSTLIVAQRTGRRAVLVTNHGTVDVYVGVTGLTTGNGFLLKGIAGATVSIPTAAAIYGITGSSQAVSFMEVF